MDSIGAEVGQKMRSAIKAKLLELNCYVDDELPDYIMVMVANKRTKSQMNEDLSLFLSTKTSTFVEWLHIVLKKLKEVTVTNPEVYKKVAKRKSSDYPDFNIKKERKHLNIMLKCEKNESHESSYEYEPPDTHKLSEHRKVTLVETQPEDNYDDNFDIPLLSEVNLSSQEDLDNIERKIKSVKSRLGLLVESDAEDELFNAKDEIEDNLRVKNKDISMHHSLRSKISRTNIRQDRETDTTLESRSQSDEKQKHTPITFDVESPKKLSILDRLGKRTIPADKSADPKRIRSDSRTADSSSKYSRDDSDEQKERSRSRRKDYRNSSSSRKDRRSRERRPAEKKRQVPYRIQERKEARLGVMSKISIPQKELVEPEPEDELRTREVRSVVQVKPRVIPTDIPQPSKSLLLKAVAEAHRSIAQTPNVGSSKRIKGKLEGKYEEHVSPKLSQNEKNKLRKIILAQICRSTQQLDGGDSKEEVYIPKPLIQNDSDSPKYIPSSSKSSEEHSEKGTKMEQQFIVTLEEADKSVDHSSAAENEANEDEQRSRISAKSRLDRRKVPSPVTFDRLRKKVLTKSNVPDKLPVVRTPQSIKNKERCKYWPSCRQGDKCEFVHPVTNCEMFPHCQFKDQCIYLHPHCKFGPLCTKRDCSYSHTVANKTTGATKGYVPIKMNSSTLQNCKYFPQCTNRSCPYYHPKPCKYGKYCKNPTQCTFSHNFSTPKSSLSWRSK